MPFDGWRHVGDRTPTPGPGLAAREGSTLAEGWRLVVSGRLGEARGLLAGLRERAPEDPGVLTAAGFLALRSGRIEAADPLFERALRHSPPDSLPALGSVLTVLDGPDPEALFARLRRLAELEPGAALVTERLPALTLDIAESRLDAAREAARGGAGPAAVTEAYRAAIEVIPDSPDLFFEAAEAAGTGESAREWFDAVAASPAAGERQALTAGLLAAGMLEAAGDLSGSLERLDRMTADARLGRHADLAERARALGLRLEIARLPESYAQIPEAERVTREELAALLAVELGASAERAGDANGSGTPVIAIDIERSWAQNLIVASVGAGYLSLFPDHTFKPRAFVRRSELAESLAAGLRALAPETLEAARAKASGLELADLPPGHRDREAAGVVVALGLLPVSDEGSFRPRDFASGAEAARAVRALAGLIGR